MGLCSFLDLVFFGTDKKGIGKCFLNLFTNSSTALLFLNTCMCTVMSVLFISLFFLNHILDYNHFLENHHILCLYFHFLSIVSMDGVSLTIQF